MIKKKADPRLCESAFELKRRIDCLRAGALFAPAPNAMGAAQKKPSGLLL